MTAVEIPVEKYSGAVREVTLGSAYGTGTRAAAVTVGGETTLPFLAFEGHAPHRPALAVEVVDVRPGDWSPELISTWGDALDDPAEWAARAAELGADLIALKLRGCHPDLGDRSAADAVTTVDRVLAAVGVPLHRLRSRDRRERQRGARGSGRERPRASSLALGLCEEKNYRTIVAAALGNGHLVIAQTPIDVNLAKQLNILISDMGLPLERVLMDPNTGALGYGLEYTYSVMERLRLAALMGDAMTQQPMICSPGEEAWRQKEARAAEGVPDAWGDLAERGVALGGRDRHDAAAGRRRHRWCCATRGARAGAAKPSTIS